MRAEVGAAFLLCLWFLATSVAAAGSGSTKPSHFSVPFNRTLFPPGFLFGAGTSAYQSEGAANIDGRGPSIWDTFTKQHPEKISDGSNGDVAIDFYHRYKSDIHLFKEIGLDTFRFSIAWSRIFPKGKGQVNDLGVKYYNDLINELLANGMQPFVTLYHWDLPQALEDEYKGFLGPQFVDDFRNYADFCFKTFGDRVKYWVTFNEPYMFINNAYSAGSFAPGRCSSYAGTCPYGDSATEPYLAGHHLLLGHAAAVKVYKSTYQAHQKGQIGITLVTNWYEPKTKSLADVEAANRALDFWFGWFGDPIAFGDYPKSMKTNVGNRLPTFTKEQSADLIGSYDFLGVNYYTSNYVENNPTLVANKTVATDMQVTNSFKSNLGVPIGTSTDLVWLYIYPQGLHRLLVYVKEKYKNPPVYINENGVGEKNNDTKPVDEAIKDAVRIRYHDGHLRAVLKAIKDGVNVKGYYIWTIFDDFEWSAGFTSRFGLIYVDYKNNLGRHLKYSAYWLKMFLLK